MYRKYRFYIHSVALILFVITLRIFFFDVYLIPSDSMAFTILSGDVVWVRKINIRKRLFEKEPVKPLPIYYNDVIVFNFPIQDSVYQNRPNRNYANEVGIFGYAKAQADTAKFGSLVALPIKYRQPYIKRCVALPGDTVQVINDSLYVNGSLVPFLESFSMHERPVRNNNNGNKKAEQQQEVKKNPEFKFAFPHVKRIKWFPRYFGPLVLPAKGETVVIDTFNLPIYKRIILNYEGNTLAIKNGEVIINEIPANTYTFKQDYYFMMGDNRNYSIDSRMWGMVPADHVIGIGKRIVFSKDGSIRWERFFKKIK